MPIWEADQLVEQAVRWMNNNLRGSLPEQLMALAMKPEEATVDHPSRVFRNMAKYLNNVAELHLREKLPNTDEIYKSIFRGLQPKDWAESLYKARKIQLGSVEDVLSLLEAEIKKLSTACRFIQECFDVKGEKRMGLVFSDTKPTNGNSSKKKETPNTKSEGANSKDKSNPKDTPRVKIELLKDMKSTSDLKPEQYDKLKSELRQSCFKCGSYDHQSRTCKNPKPTDQNPRGDLFRKLYKIVNGKEGKDKSSAIYAICEKNQTFKSEAYQRASLIISNRKEETLKVTIAKDVITPPSLVYTLNTLLQLRHSMKDSSRRSC
jgi:hypothetical protein